MTNKEIEKKLQESADNIELRDFDEVWREIGPQIETKQKKKKIGWRRWMPLAASFLVVTVAACVSLPFILPNVLHNGNDSSSSDEIRYLDSELERTAVQRTEFFACMEQSDLETVDFSTFEFLSSFIYHTDDGQTKGAFLEAYKEQAGIVHYFRLTFYDVSVDYFDVNFSNLNLSYITENGADIDYKHDETTNLYYIAGEYKNINYYMKYTPGGGEITEFFEEFFQ